MAWLYLGGGEAGVTVYDSLGLANNPINKATGLPVRCRQFSFAWPFRPANLFRQLGVSVWQGATELCGAYVFTDGTWRLFRGAFPGTTIASGIVGAVAPGQYYDTVLSGELDTVDGALELLVDGGVAVTFAGRTVPGAETYWDRRRIICNYDGISPTIETAHLRAMPDTRSGAKNYFIGFGGSAIDDDCICAPSLLLSTTVGTPVADELLTGGTSGATINASDFDDVSTYQDGGTARAWGYNATGTFVDGEAVTAPSGFAGLAVVPAAAADGGLEPPFMPLANWYLFPYVPQSNTGDPRELTNVGALASWAVAAQIPGNPSNYLENSSGMTETDSWNSSGNLLSNDTIGGFQFWFNARQTDASITHIEGSWIDSSGTNTTSPLVLPTDWAEIAGDVWGMRADGTALDPTDLTPTAVTAGTLLP